MEKLIASCGLNCATCDARIATMANDDDLRRKTAEKWKVQFNSPDISPEIINCTGCLEAGAKLVHCEQCEIRNCAKSKNYRTCAECDQLESCPKLKNIFQYAPDALENLKSLN